MLTRQGTFRTGAALAVLSLAAAMAISSQHLAATAGTSSHALLVPDDNTVVDNVQTGETTLTDIGTNSSPTFVASDAGSASAISGVSTSGSGVDGQGYYGVYGHSVTVGVYGWSESGTAIRAETVDGTALDVQGVASFSRSGIVTVPQGVNRVTVTGVPLSSASLILATVQQTAGAAWARAVVPDVPAGAFTIVLNKTAPTAILVAWFVVN
jgi:hypothetical protein